MANIDKYSHLLLESFNSGFGMRHGPSGQPVLSLPRSRWGQGAGVQRRSRKAVFAAIRLVVTAEERHFVGGTGTSAGGQAGDGLVHCRNKKIDM